MFYATVKAICVLSLTSGHPSEPDASGSALQWDFVGLCGAGGQGGGGGGLGFVTRTGHRVKMGCCLPRPSNPAIAGNFWRCRNAPAPGSWPPGQMAAGRLRENNPAPSIMKEERLDFV